MLNFIVISNYLLSVAFAAFVESDEGGKQSKKVAAPELPIGVLEQGFDSTQL